LSVIQEIPVARRETMVEAITKALIDHIAEQRLGPGDRLPSERQLVQMTGASRLPLREALATLKGLGVIESWHGKGIFVKQFDLSALFGMLSPLLKINTEIDLEGIFVARLSLEMSIAELAAKNRTDEHLQLLRQDIDEMRAAIRDKDAYIQHDTHFHRELSRAAANPVFVVFMSSIMDLLVELQVHVRDRISYRELAVCEHEKIVDAIAGQDASGASLAIESHLRNAMERL